MELPLDISTWDEQCMEAFIKQNSSLFHVFAGRYIDDDDVIDDFLQEAYIKLWIHRMSIGKVSSIRNYFFTILRNTIIDKWTYLSSFNHSIKDDQYLNIASNETFVQHIIEAETSRLIVDAIEKLSPQSRQVLMMTIEGKTMAEIAETMKITINTVKTVKYRALDRLSKSLSKEDFLIFLFFLPFELLK